MFNFDSFTLAFEQDSNFLLCSLMVMQDSIVHGYIKDSDQFYDLINE